MRAKRKSIVVTKVVKPNEQSDKAVQAAKITSNHTVIVALIAAFAAVFVSLINNNTNKTIQNFDNLKTKSVEDNQGRTEKQSEPQIQTVNPNSSEQTQDISQQANNKVEIILPKSDLGQSDAQKPQKVEKETKLLTEYPIYKEFLEKWKDSQEKQDFFIYQSLYSQNFRGIKRTINSIYPKQYSYKTWMLYRKSMNDKATYVKIEIENPEILVEGKTAVIRFTQRYSSSSYCDRGLKEILIENFQNKLKIVNEEMMPPNQCSSVDRVTTLPNVQKVNL